MNRSTFNLPNSCTEECEVTIVEETVEQYGDTITIIDRTIINIHAINLPQFGILMCAKCHHLHEMHIGMVSEIYESTTIINHLEV